MFLVSIELRLIVRDFLQRDTMEVQKKILERCLIAILTDFLEKHLPKSETTLKLPDHIFAELIQEFYGESAKNLRKFICANLRRIYGHKWRIL